jgi:hypothetical protein
MNVVEIRERAKTSPEWMAVELMKKIEQLEMICRNLQVQVSQLESTKADRKGRKPNGMQEKG